MPLVRLIVPLSRLRVGSENSCMISLDILVKGKRCSLVPYNYVVFSRVFILGVFGGFSRLGVDCFLALFFFLLILFVSLHYLGLEEFGWHFESLDL